MIYLKAISYGFEYIKSASCSFLWKIQNLELVHINCMTTGLEFLQYGRVFRSPCIFQAPALDSVG